MDTRRFTPIQAHALNDLAAEYAETFRRFDEPERGRSAGKMFAAALAVVLDPESPADCLAMKELGPLMSAGIDLADERVQEDVLAYVLDGIRNRDRWMVV